MVIAVFGGLGLMGILKRYLCSWGSGSLGHRGVGAIYFHWVFGYKADNNLIEIE